MFTISAKIHPTLQTSIDEEYFFDPKRTSGALYHKVTTSLVYPATGTPTALASPKSANFKIPSLLTSKF